MHNLEPPMNSASEVGQHERTTQASHNTMIYKQVDIRSGHIDSANITSTRATLSLTTKEPTRRRRHPDSEYWVSTPTDKDHRIFLA